MKRMALRLRMPRAPQGARTSHNGTLPHHITQLLSGVGQRRTVVSVPSYNAR
jgi:hypothetical protein